MKKLTIGHLYPDLLNLYGDRGNIQCFRKRLEWRGMEAEVIPFLSGEKIDFSKLDIVLLGGGSDREQELVCGFLKDIKDDFKAYVEDGGVVLAVCGGYQLLGKYYKTNKKTIEGLSILDITTEWQPERLIRNIVLNSPLFEQPVVGFENHGGRTYHSLFAFIILYLSIYLYKDFFFPITTTPAVSDTPRRTIHTANCPSSPVLGDGTVALTGFTVGVVSTVVSTVVSSFVPV